MCSLVNFFLYNHVISTELKKQDITSTPEPPPLVLPSGHQKCEIANTDLNEEERGLALPGFITISHIILQADWWDRIGSTYRNSP